MMYLYIIIIFGSNHLFFFVMLCPISVLFIIVSIRTALIRPSIPFHSWLTIHPFLQSSIRAFGFSFHHAFMLSSFIHPISSSTDVPADTGEAHRESETCLPATEFDRTSCAEEFCPTRSRCPAEADTGMKGIKKQKRQRILITLQTEMDGRMD